ncbi:MAG: hypothetical protein N3F07_00575 [Candidatus Micrarchaeota archaeon]|nr:hypothetical protein [Candidatus Micrarchaeota archaeon]
MQASCRGQGATEYLVLLAIVLIIAMVAVALLGFFPGMAGDAKLAQSKAYWQSASPIAIVDGAASRFYGAHSQILLTLQNNGATPVELVAVGPIRSPWTYTITHNEYGQITKQGKYAFFSPGWFSTGYGPDLEGTWRGYVAPPEGNGWDYYQEKLVISPGEKITIGFYASAHDPSLSDSYPYTNPCSFGEEAVSKYYEFKQFNIYYVSYAENGEKLLKRQAGSKPLVLSCTEGEFW